MANDLDMSQTNPLAVNAQLPELIYSSTGESQGCAGNSRLKELQERLQSRHPKNTAW